jgi:hypothetical protein
MKVKIERDKEGKIIGSLLIFGKYASFIQVREDGNNTEVYLGETHHGAKIRFNASMLSIVNDIYDAGPWIPDNNGPKLANSEEVK